MELLSTTVAFGMPFRNSPIPSSSLSISASLPITNESPRPQSQSQIPIKKSIKLSNSKPFSSFSSTTKKPTPIILQQLHQSSDLVSTLSKVGESLTVKDLNATMHHFANSNKFNNISQLFVWMQENKKVDMYSYSHYIKFMANKLDAPTMLKLYNTIQDESAKDNVYICNSVLRCIIRKGNFDTAIKLFHQMKLDGLVPDVVTYSTLLAGYARVKHGYPKALELIQEMQNNELKMDDVIYGAILAVCASNSKWGEAEYYFKRMKDEGHSPNAYHYSSLLNAYSSCGDFKKADMLIQDMKSEGSF